MTSAKAVPAARPKLAPAKVQTPNLFSKLKRNWPLIKSHAPTGLVCFVAGVFFTFVGFEAWRASITAHCVSLLGEPRGPERVSGVVRISEHVKTGCETVSAFYRDLREPSEASIAELEAKLEAQNEKYNARVGLDKP